MILNLLPSSKLSAWYEGPFSGLLIILFLCSEAEESSKIRAPTTMKKFEDSEKAKKPVRSMIETRGEKPKEKGKNNKKNKGAKKEGGFQAPGTYWGVKR